MAPPSTPAPKFIFHRPQAQHHHQQGAHSSPRFITPRFTTATQPGPPSSSTPKPSQLFVQSGARPRHREEIESSPPSSPVGPRAVPETDDERGLGGDGSEEDECGKYGLRERERKRRRISISPDVDDDDGDDERIEPEELRKDSRSLASATEDDDGDERDEDQNIAESPLEDRSSRASSLDLLAQGDRFPSPAARQQPTFQPPPRFRIPSGGAHHFQAEALPPAFSPQRKGARYVPFGLAAEMQGWLSHIKGMRAEAEGVLRLVVGEVREGGRMYLVRGRRVVVVSSSGGGGEGEVGDEMRVLLAGEGELTGLGPRAPVKVGCVVEAGGLRWDIELDGLGKWIVVCDWKVVGVGPAPGE